MSLQYSGCLFSRLLLLKAIAQEKMYVTEKHNAHVRRLLAKEDDIRARCAHAATFLTNLGDKVRELRYVPNLGSNMYFVLYKRYY